MFVREGIDIKPRIVIVLSSFFGVFYCPFHVTCQKCGEPDSSQMLVIKQSRCYSSKASRNSSSGLTVLLDSQEETTVGFFPVLCNAQMSLTPAPARKKVDHEHMGDVDLWFSACWPQNTTPLLNLHNHSNKMWTFLMKTVK